MKREAALKSAFTAELKRQAPQYVSLLFTTAGAPDRCITGDRRTTFWEFKHGTPGFVSPGIQELLCLRLAQQGHYCRYVLWLETSSGKNPRTLVVHPAQVHDGSHTPEVMWVGYDHRALVTHLLHMHRQRRD